MNPTETRLAAVFFAELLLPLRRANMRRGVALMDRGARRNSYWGGVVSRTGGVERLSSSALDAQAMLRLLGDYWALRNEPALPQLLPHLEKLRQELSGKVQVEDRGKGALSEFTYPLF